MTSTILHVLLFFQLSAYAGATAPSSQACSAALAKDELVARTVDKLSGRLKEVYEREISDVKRDNITLEERSKRNLAGISYWSSRDAEAHAEIDAESAIAILELNTFNQGSSLSSERQNLISLNKLNTQRGKLADVSKYLEAVSIIERGNDRRKAADLARAREDYKTAALLYRLAGKYEEILELKEHIGLVPFDEAKLLALSVKPHRIPQSLSEARRDDLLDAKGISGFPWPKRRFIHEVFLEEMRFLLENHDPARAISIGLRFFSCLDALEQEELDRTSLEVQVAGAIMYPLSSGLDASALFSEQSADKSAFVADFYDLACKAGYCREGALYLLSETAIPAVRARGIRLLEQQGDWLVLAEHNKAKAKLIEAANYLVKAGRFLEAANIYASKGAWAKAGEAFKLAGHEEGAARAALKVRGDGSALLQIAKAYERAGRWGDALELYREVKSADLADKLEKKLKMSLSQGEIKGIRLLSGGRSIAFLVTFIDGQQGVFKPDIGGAWGEARHDVGTYRLSLLLQSLRIPFSVARTIDGMPGVVEAWVHEAIVGRDSSMGSRLTGDLRYIDYLRMNHDRHWSNFLVRDGAVVGIDNVGPIHLTDDYIDLEELMAGGPPSKEFIARLSEVLAEDDRGHAIIEQTFADVWNKEEIAALKRRMRTLLAASWNKALPSKE